MSARSSSVILVLVSMSVGLMLGLVLGRGGPVASAQVANTPREGVSRVSASEPMPPESSKARAHDEEVYDRLAKEYERFEHVNRMYELVAKAVTPAVVHIIAQKTVRQEENQRVRKFEETGSGVIVRSDKSRGLYVLTNHHVIDGGKAAKIRIFLHDGRTLTPERIWSDAKADIAVLKLDRTDLPAARMGDSDTMPVGSWVLAMGSPFGLMHSVSQGIISARGRHMDELQDVDNQDFLQTDAAINPGNSGGPLVNMKGEVIGINNSIASNGGGNEGVGFSIPINLARWIMNELIVHGHVIRGALGVDLQPEFRQEDALTLGLDRPRGAWIDRVHPDSPAAKAGIRGGDVILRFGKVEIHDLNHLINTVSMTPVGEPSEVLIWRDRQEIKLKVTVGERERTLAELPPIPDRTGDPSALIRRPNRPSATTSFVMGLELMTIDAQLARRFQLPETLRGAMILTVDPESPLANLCRPNDIISSINDQAIGSADQVVKLMNERNNHDKLILSLDRQTGSGLERHIIRIP